MLCPDTGGRSSWKRKLCTQLRLFSNTCGAMIAEPTASTTPPSSCSTLAQDFRKFCASVEQLDGGVVLAVGSAIMAPQVFEKSLSCVHNLRFQEERPPVSGHSIYVV